MNEYRTPDERRHSAAQDLRVAAVLNQAVKDGASIKAAILLDEPPAVVEQWVNTFWNGLRTGLVDGKVFAGEDRLAAIVMLLDPQISEHTSAILDELRDLPLSGGAA